MTTEQAAAARKLLGARLVFPIHYGTPNAAQYSEQSNPEQTFLAAARESRISAQIVPPGSWFGLSGERLKTALRVCRGREGNYSGPEAPFWELAVNALRHYRHPIDPESRATRKQSLYFGLADDSPGTVPFPCHNVLSH
jgi:hypothetical protein